MAITSKICLACENIVFESEPKQAKRNLSSPFGPSVLCTTIGLLNHYSRISGGCTGAHLRKANIPTFQTVSEVLPCQSDQPVKSWQSKHSIKSYHSKQYMKSYQSKQSKKSYHPSSLWSPTNPSSLLCPTHQSSIWKSYQSKSLWSPTNPISLSSPCSPSSSCSQSNAV